MRMNELREMRDELEKQMVEAAESENGIIEKRIVEFLGDIKNDYGIFDIQYEIKILWEDENSETPVGIDPFHVCNV